MRIAIHQPNFCPVKGYFDKIKEVDLFIFMVQCQWEKGKYQNRFHVGSQWNTMSVNRGLEPIMNKRYVNNGEDWARITTRYQQLAIFDTCVSDSLALTNMNIIILAMEMLNIRTQIMLDFKTDLTGTERLVQICREFQATEYLSGKSGRNYLDLVKFGDIKVSFQDNPDLTPLVQLI